MEKKGVKKVKKVMQEAIEDIIKIMHNVKLYYDIQWYAKEKLEKILESAINTSDLLKSTRSDLFIDTGKLSLRGIRRECYEYSGRIELDYYDDVSETSVIILSIHPSTVYVSTKFVEVLAERPQEFLKWLREIKSKLDEKYRAVKKLLEVLESFSDILTVKLSR